MVHARGVDRPVVQPPAVLQLMLLREEELPGIDVLAVFGIEVEGIKPHPKTAEVPQPAVRGLRFAPDIGRRAVRSRGFAPDIGRLAVRGHGFAPDIGRLAVRGRGFAPDIGRQMQKSEKKQKARVTAGLRSLIECYRAGLFCLSVLRNLP